MTATDSVGIKQMSNVVIVTIGNTMNPTISPVSAILDLGQSQLYAVTVSGGTPPYSYQWYQWLPSGSEPFIGATEATFNFTPSSTGLNIIYVEITDSLGVSVDIGAAAAVNPPLSASISPSSGAIDFGQSQVFTSSVAGGTPPYLYQWYMNGTGVTGAVFSSWMFTPSSAGTYIIFLKVTDTLGTTGESSIAMLVVNPPLTILVSPTSVGLEIGESWTFIASISNGTPPYSLYQWYLNGAPVMGATSSTWTYEPLVHANRTIYVTATDSTGFESTSNTVIVTVSTAMNPTISPSSATLDLSQSQSYTVTVSGGAPPYSYQWYQWLPSGSEPFTGATNPTFVFTPSIGFNIIYVVITDSHGVKVNWGATATANPQPSATISPESVTMDIGMSQHFTSIAINGTSPYTYQWYIDGSPVSGATSSTWTYTAAQSSVGVHTVYLIVTDSVNFAVYSNSATIIVNPPLTASILPTSTATDVGVSTLLTANITGGMPPYSYQWYVNGVLVSGATGNMFSFKPSSTGSYSILLVVTDSFGFEASNTATVAVNPPPIVSVSPTSVSIPLGQNQTFTAAVTGGTPPYSYMWYVNGVLAAQTASPTFKFTPSSISLYYELYVEVTDASSLKATSNTAIINGHDVAATGVTAVDNPALHRVPKTIFAKGFPIGINVTIANPGYYSETFTVTAYANSTIIASQIVTLASGGTAIITIVGNTTNLAYGHYTVSAYALPVTGEVNTANNYISNGTRITVTIPGDITGDGKVTAADLHALGVNWGLSVPPGDPNADVNGDGKVGVADLNQLGVNWGKIVVL